ncbi:hypothetical protein [Pedobacter antarcticus]|uniref:hypothetical protein n=1 Tax=Pedobacter antarcticus TaxID=34086 RepID=UPI000884A637|nr:hypothetical protein [Pedobacter antarcticus]SDL85515.1 hypothetical protein SAMN04488084_102683 [Pedobacter antarcticus]
MNTQFDLFRLNCLLNDREANDLKKITTSLVCEFLYENNNEEKNKAEIIKYLIGILKVSLDFDLLDSLLSNNKYFELTPGQNDILIKLTPSKYSEINSKIKDHSIDTYIEKFLKENSLEEKHLETIKAILYSSVYDNINSFATDNLLSILSAGAHEKFQPNEIEIFNQFLEYNDHEKNTALYNVFLKAVEFALITSGRGVSKLTKDIFKDKIYVLDTNVIFRILGVGGEERRECCENLIKICFNDGVKFGYTSHTFNELRRKLEQIVHVFTRAESNNQIQVIADLIEEGADMFNQDFIVHYSQLRSAKTVNNPSQYELKILTDFNVLCKKMNIALINGQVNFEQKAVNKFAQELFKKKKKIRNKYSNLAAQVDAYNILYVRNKRGANNYNYSDVKSFYLSTDKSLNNILNEISEVKVPETIMPSQLFLIHHSFNEVDQEVDYELFLKFLKRRTSEFKYNGKDILNYISQVRMKTQNPEYLSEVLRTYANQRYKFSNQLTINKNEEVLTFNQFSETFFDAWRENNIDKLDAYEDITSRAEKSIRKAVVSTQIIIRCLDILVILLIAAGALIFKQFFKDLRVLVGIILMLEVIKFVFTTKTPILKNIWKALLLWRIKSTMYYKVSRDDRYLDLAGRYYDSVGGDVYKPLISTFTITQKTD